ncbi:Parafibromin [Trichuris trichiura]|uniref:Parafibromin n=1 Tax=Trichuris trichiura TaxID=36087 RepID=A0A077Z2W1_TRITR|nr:Parafibromin [Trichuris trichiura]
MARVGQNEVVLEEVGDVSFAIMLSSSSRALVVALLFCCSPPGGSRPEQKAGPDISGLSSRDGLLVNLLYASTLEEKRRSPVARQTNIDFPVVQPSSAQLPPELGPASAVSTLWFPVHAEQPSPAVSSVQGSAPAVISAPVIHTGPQQPPSSSAGVAHSRIILFPPNEHSADSALPTPPPLPTGAFIDPNMLPKPPGSLKPLPPSSSQSNDTPAVDQSA